ncbi:MAG: SurA N-terminal domain-containing protein [Gammaproteobacteria bacterium]
MLQDIRDNSQGVVAKVIIGLIVAVFALWGVESIIGGFIRTPPVAEVNGDEITDIQLQTNAQNLMASIGAQADQIDQELIEQIALDQLIEEMVLLQYAEANSMAVSSNQIDQAIINTEQFQISGRFDPDLAVRTMAAQGLSVPMYRQSLQQRMLLSQVANAFTSSNFVTDPELRKIVELSAQARDFRYLSITMGTRTLGTAISDEEIQQYYDANEAQFTEEETVTVRYVVLDQEFIAEEIEVEESELLAQYEVERNSFEGSAEKRASHILLEVGGDLNEAAAMELAESVRQRLLDGEDFGALALEYSADTVSAEEDGDIGYTDGSAFPAEIEQALESMTVDEISAPVVTEFGVHIVKLTEASENSYPPFAEVRERI